MTRLSIFVGIVLFTVSAKAEIPVELFINTVHAGPTNGCSGQLSGKKGSLICGHSPWVSKVAWKLLKSDSKGDHYVFTRDFPYKQPSHKITTKQVTFDGGEIELWKDDEHRIILRKPKT